MVIDTSALIAILFDEPDAARLVQAILSSETPLVGAPTFVEAAAVLLARKGPQGEIALDALMQRLKISVVPMSPEAAMLTRAAYARHGKGVGSPGVLNFGDCLAFGVAQALNKPLLFIGNDFPRTDVQPAPY